MTTDIITVFGGSGFIGSSLIMRLTRQGYRVRVAVRNTDNANHLRVYGDVGQVMPVQVHISQKQSVYDVVKGSAGVVNLIGILFEKGASTFQKSHVIAAETIAEACAHHDVPRLVHVSALGASADSSSKYARTKAEGEEAVFKHFPNASILRPSVVFGPSDQFLNKFAKLGTILPIMAAFEKGATKFQPVYVGDVAEAILTCLETNKCQGKLYELGGPETYTLKDLMRYSVQATGREPVILDMPKPLGKMMAYVFGLFPNPVITPDQLKLLQQDNVVCKKSKGLKDLGIEPSHLEAIAPRYLKCYQKQF